MVLVTAPVLVCKRAGDDRNHGKRPALRPGPYCASCRRDVKRERRAAAHGRHVVRTYGITAEEYRQLYDFQAGRCYVCTRATGARKRLAVEHDHVLALQHGHPVTEGCRECITGLACGPCNQDVLGRLGRNPETYRRVADALEHPPARRLFGRITP